MLLLRKRSMLMFGGFRFDRFFDTNSLALENALSEGTDVAGIHRYFLNN